VSTKEKKHTGIQEGTQEEELKKLILWNDDVNSFDYVIESLVEVCEHDPMQAETCAWIAHFKGKCPVKRGSFDDLKPYYAEMSNRKLTVEII
jgi:ATP-dependent Clp protease adaptor protein ClpS